MRISMRLRTVEKSTRGEAKSSSGDRERQGSAPLKRRDEFPKIQSKNWENTEQDFEMSDMNSPTSYCNILKREHPIAPAHPQTQSRHMCRSNQIILNPQTNTK